MNLAIRPSQTPEPRPMAQKISSVLWERYQPVKLNVESMQWFVTVQEPVTVEWPLGADMPKVNPEV